MSGRGGASTPRLIVDCARLGGGSVDAIEVQRRCELDEPEMLGARVLDAAVDLDVTVRAATGSFIVTGRLIGVWCAECRRCLGEVRGDLDVSLREVFEWEPTEGETWPITDLRIDLAPAAREAAVLALPLAPLCAPDCAGPVPERFPTGPPRDRDR